jgi:hypothetical protein
MVGRHLSGPVFTSISKRLYGDILSAKYEVLLITIFRPSLSNVHSLLSWLLLFTLAFVHIRYCLVLESSPVAWWERSTVQERNRNNSTIRTRKNWDCKYEASQHRNTKKLRRRGAWDHNQKQFHAPNITELNNKRDQSYNPNYNNNKIHLRKVKCWISKTKGKLHESLSIKGKRNMLWLNYSRIIE